MAHNPPKTVIKVGLSIPKGGSKACYVGTVSQTVRDIGQFGEQNHHGPMPAWSSPYDFLHHTKATSNPAMKNPAITAFRTP